MEVTQAGAPAAPEVPAAAPVETQAPPAAPAEDVSSQRFVELARRERQAQQMRTQLKAEQAQAAEWKAKYESFEKAKASAKLNPDAALRELGLSKDDIDNFYLNGKEPTVDAQVQELRAQLEARDRAQQEREAKAQQQAQEANQRAAQEAMENFKTETREFVSSKPDEYELINFTDSQDLVIQTIEEHWVQGVKRYEESGEDPKLKPKILDKAEAAALVEKFLEEKVEKVLSGKKYGSKYKRIEEAMAEVAKDVQGAAGFQKTVQAPTASVKPIHNGLVSTALPGPGSTKSADAKMQAALKRLQESKS